MAPEPAIDDRDDIEIEGPLMNDQDVSETLNDVEDTTVTITRLVSSPVKEVWKVLCTPEGGEALLGAGGVIGRKGEKWRAGDGTWGVIRSYHPLEQLRFSWHDGPDAPNTLVDLQLVAAGDATNIEIRHEHVPAQTDTAALVRRWETALDRVWAQHG